METLGVHSPYLTDIIRPSLSLAHLNQYPIPTLTHSRPPPDTPSPWRSVFFSFIFSSFSLDMVLT
jgi:hypothetical protein